MAEDHRRVEPRQIVGTGMATDPSRIEDIEREAERKKRAWRNAPEQAFGDVLSRAPKATDVDVVEEDAPEDAEVAAAEEKAAKPQARLSPRAPDPRAKHLHALLDKKR